MSDQKNQEAILKQVEQWLEDVVIGLNLCPFARKPYTKGQVRVVVEPTLTVEEVFNRVIEELQLLAIEPTESLETTVLVVPNLFKDFHDYLDALAYLDQLIDVLGRRGEIQIASFHPHYQFEGEGDDAKSNYTNRSPYPIFHFIREDSMEKMLARYPDSDQIPETNVITMNALTEEQIQKLLPWLRQ